MNAELQRWLASLWAANPPFPTVSRQDLAVFIYDHGGHSPEVIRQSLAKGWLMPGEDGPPEMVERYRVGWPVTLPIPADNSGPEAEAGKGSGGRVLKPGINARMLETMQTNPDVMGWTAKRWAQWLHCGMSTVVATPTWKDLAMGRQRQRAEKKADRRRRANASKQKRD